MDRCCVLVVAARFVVRAPTSSPFGCGFQMVASCAKSVLSEKSLSDFSGRCRSSGRKGSCRVCPYAVIASNVTAQAYEHIGALNNSMRFYYRLWQ
jgi:hypothetical protein